MIKKVRRRWALVPRAPSTRIPIGRPLSPSGPIRAARQKKVGGHPVSHLPACWEVHSKFPRLPLRASARGLARAASAWGAEDARAWLTDYLPLYERSASYWTLGSRRLDVAERCSLFCGYFVVTRVAPSPMKSRLLSTFTKKSVLIISISFHNSFIRPPKTISIFVKGPSINRVTELSRL
jgi:hypothetical protein